MLADFELKRFHIHHSYAPMMYKDMQCVAVKERIRVKDSDVFDFFLMQFAMR